VQYEKVSYNADPLLCPKCHGEMKIISFIEDKAVIEKILRQLGLWENRNHDPPAGSISHIAEGAGALNISDLLHAF